MNGLILLVRHAEVALRWRGRCYGQTDVGLSREGVRQSKAIAGAVLRRGDSHRISAVIHSGLRRASYLAELIAAAASVVPRADHRWSERNFGSWETRSWNSIWRGSGNAMDGMLTDPAKFRPGGGETTAQLFARSIRAWHSLPEDGLVIVVTHGGPIACVRCHLADAELPRLGEFMVAEGATVEVLRYESIQT